LSDTAEDYFVEKLLPELQDIVKKFYHGKFNILLTVIEDIKN
jgi:hypothetical protein